MMKIVAHRGASLAHTENSLPAFRQALRDGADGLEVDIRRSADNQIYCFHDHKLSRLTGRSGYFRRTESPRLESLRLKGGSPIPTLSQFLREFAGGTEIVLDIKSAGIERELLELLCAHGIERTVLFSSFNATILSRIGELLPQARLAWIVGPIRNLKVRLDLSGYIARELRRLRAEAVHLSDLLITEKLVKKLKAAGFRVAVWTVDNPSRAEALRVLGVSAVISNDPKALIKRLRP